MNETPPGLVPTPEGNADWLADLKTRIHTAQQRAMLAINRELVLLYWQIGQDILTRLKNHQQRLMYAQSAIKHGCQ